MINIGKEWYILMKSMTNFNVARFVSRPLNKLPNCIYSYVKSILANKKDDMLLITHYCGYEIWLWDKSLNIDIARIY